MKSAEMSEVARIFVHNGVKPYPVLPHNAIHPIFFILTPQKDHFQACNPPKWQGLDKI